MLDSPSPLNPLRPLFCLVLSFPFHQDEENKYTMFPKKDVQLAEWDSMVERSLFTISTVDSMGSIWSRLCGLVLVVIVHLRVPAAMGVSNVSVENGGNGLIVREE